MSRNERSCSIGLHSSPEPPLTLASGQAGRRGLEKRIPAIDCLLINLPITVFSVLQLFGVR